MNQSQPKSVYQKKDFPPCSKPHQAKSLLVHEQISRKLGNEYHLRIGLMKLLAARQHFTNFLMPKPNYQMIRKLLFLNMHSLQRQEPIS
jgi:hypothetical protein